MKTRPLLLASLSLGVLFSSCTAQAYDADWKRGRIYYRSVCTACHAAQAGGSIAPSTLTKAQWEAYLQADRHAKGKDSLKAYLGKPYRASIKAQNKAAEKFAEVPDAEMAEDVRAFVLKGAKDGDAPASCN